MSFPFFPFRRLFSQLKLAVLGLVLLCFFGPGENLSAVPKTQIGVIQDQLDIKLSPRKLTALNSIVQPLYQVQEEFSSEEKITDFPIDGLGVKWHEETPFGTRITLFVRFYQDNAWTEFHELERDDETKTDENLSGVGYSFILANRAEKFQYRVLLESDISERTPVLKDIEFNYYYSPDYYSPDYSGVQPNPLSSLTGSAQRKPDQGSILSAENFAEAPFHPSSIDFDQLIAGLLVVSDRSPNIISRSEWKADESIRILSGERPPASLVPIEDDFYEKYKNELKLSHTITHDSTGQEFLWPLEYASKIRKIIVHHTATTKDLDNPKAAIRAIYNYHAVTRGWGDIGYNYIIDQQGRVYEGRAGGEKVVGAHAGKANIGSIGIGLLGDYDADEIPYPALQSLINLIDTKTELYNLSPDGRSRFRGKVIPNIIGHRDVEASTCPGQYLYAKLPVIRELLANDRYWGKVALCHPEETSPGGGVSNDDSSECPIDTPEKFDFFEVSDREPLVLDPSSQTQITLKLKNTGTETWNNQTFLVANQNPKNENRITFTRVGENQSNIASLQENQVRPGQIGTFTIEIQSSLKSGLVSFDVTPIFNGSKKTRRYLDLPIYIKLPTLDYQLIKTVQKPERTLAPGQKTEALIQLKNLSNIPWHRDDPFPIHLGTDHPRDRLSPFTEKSARLGYLQEEIVEPNQIGTFKLEFTAPQAPGFYEEYFTPVIEQVSWFQDQDLHFNFVVSGEEYKLEFVSASQDTRFKRGETKSVWLKVRNVGDAIITPDGNKRLRLGVIKNQRIKTTPPILEKAISPGQIGLIKLDVTAPRTTGLYHLYLWPRVSGQRLTDKPLYFQFRAVRKQDLEQTPEIIRVALSFQGNPVITGDGDFDLYVNNQNLQTFTIDDKVEVTYNDGQYFLKYSAAAMVLGNYPRFVPASGTILEIDNFENRPAWNPALNDNRYRGLFEVRNVNNGSLTVINELPLEDYLKGLAEVSNIDPYEKIKAIVVAARSYAQHYLEPENRKFPGKPYDASDDPSIFQKYSGYGYEIRSSKTVQAVEETVGEVVTYQGKLVKTPYFSQSNGRTLSGEEAFGWTNTPWLQSVEDPYCEDLERRGHGVGMSGCGSKGAAEDGKTYQEILRYYYQGINIEKLD